MSISKFTIFLIFGLLASITLFGQVLSESNLPIVIINTNGLEIMHDDRITADLGIIFNGTGQVNHIEDPWNNYNGKISIELRGNTSLSFPKKSYSFETQDENGNNLNTPLAGLPEENDWILYGPYSDKSLMRNVITYELARRMGQYAPRTRFCEVILNDEYTGVSVLIEKIKQDENRLDIAKLTENDTIGDDLTGGYILRIDRHSGEGWSSSYTQYVYYEFWDPDDNAILPIQQNYIHQYVDSVETAIYNLPVTSDSLIQKLIDVDAFCDFIISSELAKNVDAYRLSTYLHKDKDSNNGGLKLGPLWDFNIAYGNCHDFNGYHPENFMYSYTNFIDYRPFYVKKLMEQPFFINEIRCKWEMFREYTLSENSIISLIDSCALVLNEAQQRNFEKWDILGNYVWPNYYIGEDYNEEIELLKNWIYQRLYWMDVFLPGECPQNYVDLNEDKTLVIFPNPFVNLLRLKFNKPNFNTAELQLFDCFGQLITKRTINSIEDEATITIFIDYENVSNGFYFWKLIADDKTNYSGKLIRRK